MEPPLEREGKGGKVSIKKVEKSSYEQRLQLTKTVFQLFSFFKKQTTVCKKHIFYIFFSIFTVSWYRYQT